MDKVLAAKLTSLRKTLSVAESCTGGLVAHRLTQQAGASAYFLGGIVCYSNASKIDLLGVDPQLIEAEGAVSEAVVRQLAEGALRVFHSDYSLAITGIAGPTGGTIGTAWLAIGQMGQPTTTWKVVGPPQEREQMLEFFAETLLTSFKQTLHS